MDDALVTGVMAGAVLSATLTQGFRLWRAEHTADPACERRAAGATWLLVLAVAVLAVAAVGTSPGPVGGLVLLVPAGAALGLHPRVAATWGVVAVLLVALSLGGVPSVVTPEADPATVALLATGGVLGLVAATAVLDGRLRQR